MVMDRPFTTVSQVLANYSFIELVSGTGYIVMYAGKTIDKNVLSNYTYYSIPNSTGGTTTQTGTYATLADVDFDVLVNKTLILEGMGIVNVATKILLASSAGHCLARVTLRKWDGSTETDIVTNDSVTNGTINTTTYKMTAVDLVIPETIFVRGETLRLNITLLGKQNSAGSQTSSFGHDPKDLGTGWSETVPSTLTFQMPVKNEL